MYKRTFESWVKHWDFILLDSVSLQLAFILGYSYRFGFSKFVYSDSTYQNIGLMLFVFSVFVAIIFSTMEDVLKRSAAEEIRKTLEQCFLVFASVTIFLFSIKESETISRITIYVTMIIYPVLGFVTRMIYRRILFRSNKFGMLRSILLITSNRQTASDLIESFKKHPQEGIIISGLVFSDDSDTSSFDDIPVVSDLTGASEYICRKWIDEVYVAVPQFSSQMLEMLDHCAEMGVTVHQQLLTNTAVRRKQSVGRIAEQPVLTSSINNARPWQLLVKRIFDIISGLLLSIASCIVLLIISPLVRKASPGPVLLKQERVGLNGKKFGMYSIRTMYMDAESRMESWRKAHPDVNKVSLDEDPRFIGNENGKTGIGVKLRRLGIEDLPMAFNVLLGQMSFVGTRAPSIEEWEHYQFHHRARLSTKPGITGLWQASGRSKTMSFEEATAMDTDYITNWNLGLDLRILFKSIFLRGDSAAHPSDKDQK